MNQRHVVWQSDELTTCCQLLLSSVNWRIVVDDERTTCICLTWSLEANVFSYNIYMGVVIKKTNDTVNACLSFSGFLYNNKNKWIYIFHVSYYIIYIYEMSPKFKCCKMDFFLSFGLKVPFGFPCLAHVCFSNSFGFVCFSTAYVTLVVALLFGSLVLLPAFLQGFIQSASVPPLHYVALRGGRACMFLRVDGLCFWFCGLRVIAFSSRAKHMLQIPEVLQAVL